MTVASYNPCDVSVASNDYRYYVKDISILDSVVLPPASDVRYNVIPSYLKMWDSVANYRSVFEPMAISPLINPVVFRPDPHTGDYQNLYKPETSAGIGWDSTTYDSNNSFTFPKGMLKPAMPVVEYNVDAYEPPLDLEIPVIPVPQERTPSLTLPDIFIPEGGGVGQISVSCNVCYLNASISYSSDSKSAVIVIDWNNPPPSSGTWVPIVAGGTCMWNTVKVCQSSQS